MKSGRKFKRSTRILNGIASNLIRTQSTILAKKDIISQKYWNNMKLCLVNFAKIFQAYYKDDHIHGFCIITSLGAILAILSDAKKVREVTALPVQEYVITPTL